MTEIIPGIYQLPLPIPNNPLRNTNCYLLRGDNSYTLIDAGWNDEGTFQSLQKQLDELKIPITDISQIIVTHAHPDHYGLAARLKQISQAKIALHSLDKQFIFERHEQLLEFFKRVDDLLRRHGLPENESAAELPPAARIQRFSPPVSPDVVLNGDETIPVGKFNLKVIWTPGHSAGHICLYEASVKLLFSGDHILPSITPNVSVRPQSRPNPLGDFVESLQKVRQLETKLVLPAHGDIFTDLSKRVDEITRHHQHRSAEVLAAIGDKSMTAYQISTGVVWMPQQGGTPWDKLAPWDKRLAVMETLAHLEQLRAEGKVSQLASNGVIYYHSIGAPVKVK